MSGPVVLSVGSCRVNDAVLDLKARGVTRLPARSERKYGHTHSTPQHRQMLRFLGGGLSLPAEVVAFAADEPEVWQARPASRDRHDLLAGVDVLVVEVCSRKEFTLGDWQVKDGNAVSAMLRRGEPFGAWWRTVLRDGRPDPELVAALTPHVTATEATMLRDVRFRRQTEEQVVSGMRAIAAGFPGTVVWVPHFTALSDDLQPLPERQFVREIVRRGAERTGGVWHDPDALVEALGPERALQDANHYRPEVVSRVGDALWDSIRA